MSKKPATSAEKKAIAALTKQQPGFGAFRAARAEEERRWEEREKKRKEEILRNAEPGQMIEGEGIFICQWAPRDREGGSLGKIFNVFAAPADLTNKSGTRATFKYKDLLKRLGGLRNWHGFDGGSYANDTELFSALKDGSYKGEWVIPTRDLLVGMDIDSNEVQPQNLCACSSKGSLKNSFLPASAPLRNKLDFPGWYWSCTAIRKNPNLIWAGSIPDGDLNYSQMDTNSMGCRPVRFVEVANPRPKP